MGLTDKLNELLKEKNITKSQLSKASGVPYTTIDGFYKKGTDNVKLSTLKKLADYFECSLDYLVDDKIELSNNTNKQVEEESTNDSIISINKDEKDVEELLEETMSQIFNQDGLMLNGQIVDDNDLILLRNALKNGIEYVKNMKQNK